MTPSGRLSAVHRTGPDYRPTSRLFCTLVILIRLLGAAFFLTTALYGIASYSAFAYYQFLLPGLITWPARLIVIHHWLYWLWLVLVTGTLLPFLRSRNRWWVTAYLALVALVGVWLISHPVLATVDNTPRSLVIALAALVFPWALSLLDHRLARVTLLPQAGDSSMLLTAFVTA